MALKRRVGVVGLGSIGRRHARLLLELNDLAIEIVEPNAVVLAAALDELGDLPAHMDFDEFLRTEPDVVWLSTPTDLHAAQSIAALESGAHVFCEKPMSNSVVEALRMKKTEETSGKIFNVGFMLHFVPGLIRLRELVQTGALGNILHVHARVGTYITLVNSVSRYQARQSGSLFLDYSHQPDLFVWLIGKPPASVRVAAIQSGDLEFSSNPNIAVAVYEYEQPLVATLHLNYVQMPERHDYEIVGDRAWAAFDYKTGELKIGSRDEQTVLIENYEFERDDIYRAQIREFFRAVSSEREPETSAAAGLISTSVCVATIEAWQKGEPTKTAIVDKNIF